MASKVFVCHSSTDKTLAHQVCQDLESEGVTCWIAPRDVAPGAQWAAELAGAIDDCGVFLLIFTSNSNGSSQVLREVERAVRRDKIIVNYRSDDVPCSSALDYYLAVHQWFDPGGTVDEDMRRLAVHLQRLCAAAATAEAPRTSAASAGASGASYRPASPGPDTRAARPAAPSPDLAAAVTFTLPAPWVATLPGLEAVYRWMSTLPWFNSLATLAIDGAVVQKMPAAVPMSIQRRLPLGDHIFELHVKFASPRKFALHLAEPGQYTVTVGRSWLTGNYVKTCHISRNGAAPVPVKGTTRFSIWRALLYCIAALWFLGFLMALFHVQ